MTAQINITVITNSGVLKSELLEKVVAVLEGFVDPYKQLPRDLKVITND